MSKKGEKKKTKNFLIRIYLSLSSHLIQFEFVQISQERVHSLLSHHLHGHPQSLEGSVSYLGSRVVDLL